MFLIALIIVYFDYMSRIVGLILLNSCNCSYSVYLIDYWVDDRQLLGILNANRKIRKCTDTDVAFTREYSRVSIFHRECECTN